MSPLDVNGDGIVAPIDALLVVNALRAQSLAATVSSPIQLDEIDEKEQTDSL